jgi:hypothetical protein
VPVGPTARLPTLARPAVIVSAGLVCLYVYTVMEVVPPLATYKVSLGPTARPATPLIPDEIVSNGVELPGP